MCETSNSPAAVRVRICSSITPAGYCTGISQPPKSTILPPSSRCALFSGVFFNSVSELIFASISGRRAAAVKFVGGERYNLVQPTQRLKSANAECTKASRDRERKAAFAALILFLLDLGRELSDRLDYLV